MASKSRKHENGTSESHHLTNNHNHEPPHKRRPGVDDGSNKLPVSQHHSKFNELLRENNSLVIVGETGSGKTTQIPKWCLGHCQGKNLMVACTQPRRIAAMTVAARVAQEMSVTLGEKVGYSVRFDSCTSSKTVLKYLTDGMLLREAMLDGLLKTYGVIIIDEAHERTLQTEILLGVVKRAMVLRNKSGSDMPELKVIIMSATIRAQKFCKYLDSKILSIEGRQHPVQDLFAEVPQSDLLTSTLITVFQIHRNSDEGDILVFCSGQDEIQSLIILCKRVLRQAPETLQNLLPLPLYAALPPSHQLRVFEVTRLCHSNGVSNGDGQKRPTFTRRVIFSTNVAETSITIPNIKFVIDTGKVKCRTYCPKTGLESLKVTSVSKAQASQRSGRAGRLSAGTCYRLFTSEEYDMMNEHFTPEIKRCNLDGVILLMISIGIKAIDRFNFFEKPDDAAVNAALGNLLSLKAIKQVHSKDKTDSNGHHQASTNGTHKFVQGGDSLLSLSYELTPLGRKMIAFPLSPPMSRVILSANQLGCLDEALTIVSLLYIENLFHIPPNKQAQAETILSKFASNEGDTIMLLKVFKAFKRTCQLNKSGIQQWCLEHFIHAKNLKLARSVRKQLLDTCKSMGMESSSCGQDTSIIRRALATGLFNNVATMWNGKYRNKSLDNLHIHPNSCLFKSRPECILYTEIMETNKCYMRNCTLIDINWIREMPQNDHSKA